MHKSLGELEEMPLTEMVLWHAWGTYKDAQRPDAAPVLPRGKRG